MAHESPASATRPPGAADVPSAPPPSGPATAARLAVAVAGVRPAPVPGTLVFGLGVLSAALLLI
ncbi:hypothetical protein ACGF12_09445 [Kitasatospora sp. NPDC048296]|uniref:hypothetical protein n=1 Tax=Kitasatospora sp. NPDC048296 TaxID=3364048 RepID=UPI00371431D7